MKGQAPILVKPKDRLNTPAILPASPACPSAAVQQSPNAASSQVVEHLNVGLKTPGAISLASELQNTNAPEDVPEAALPKGGGENVWAGRFPRQIGARNAADRIERLGLPVTVIPRHRPNDTDFFVVLSGPFAAGKIEKESSRN